MEQSTPGCFTHVISPQWPRGQAIIVIVDTDVGIAFLPASLTAVVSNADLIS